MTIKTYNDTGDYIDDILVMIDVVTDIGVVRMPLRSETVFDTGFFYAPYISVYLLCGKNISSTDIAEWLYGESKFCNLFKNHDGPCRLE
jgi:hypothetical protein